MKNTTMRILAFLILSMFIVSCASTTARWNPNKQEKSKLATLKLVNKTSDNWSVLSADGRELSKYWKSGEDNILISTEEHTLEIGIVVGGGWFSGGSTHAEKTLKLKIKKLLTPGTAYKLTYSAPVWDGPGGSRFTLEEDGFFFSTTLQTWKVKLTGTNEWSIVGEE